MITRNHSLWTRLQSFEFDTGSPSLTFAQRLAQEQRWTPAFALRVLEEYRRFLFLACTLKHPVTPSKPVDEAWHLHLTYTRSYWERLCPQVLQRSLHHDPTRGGAAESAKFVDWYQRTLEAYREAFDQEPSSDVWPSSKARLTPPGGPPELTGVVAETSDIPLIVPARNDADYWIIRKPSRERALTSVACGLGVMLIGGCTPLVLGTGNSSFPVLLILGLFAVTGLLLLLIAAYRKHGGRDCTGQTGGSGGGGCSTYIDSSGTHTGGGHHGHGCGHGCDGGSHGGSDGAGGSGDGGGGGGCGGGGDGGGGGGCGGGGDGGGGGGCGGGGCGGGGD